MKLIMVFIFILNIAAAKDWYISKKDDYVVILNFVERYSQSLDGNHTIGVICSKNFSPMILSSLNFSGLSSVTFDKKLRIAYWDKIKGSENYIFSSYIDKNTKGLKRSKKDTNSFIRDLIKYNTILLSGKNNEGETISAVFTLKGFSSAINKYKNLCRVK